MKKVSKFLLWLFVCVFLVLIAIYLTAGFWVKNAVSTLVPQMTKTSASLEKADISLLSGKISFKGFKVGNPQGFSNNNAFELEEVSVRFQPTTLFSQKIIVDEVKISGTKVNSEVNKAFEMNLMVINNNIRSYLGMPAMDKLPTENKAQKKEEVKKSGKDLVVRDLQIVNSKVDFSVLSQKMTVSLPNIQEKNIGETEKMTLPEFVAGFFAELTGSSLEAITQANKKTLDNVFDYLSQKTKGNSTVQNLVKQMPSLF